MWLRFFCAAIAWTLVSGGESQVNVTNLQNVTTFPQMMSAVTRANSVDVFMGELKTAINAVIREVMPVVLRSDYSSNVNPVCTASLLYFIMAMSRLDEWALHMLDANGKIPSGILRGTVTSMGDYDQCLRSFVGSPDSTLQDETNFWGQYCSVEITINVSKTPSKNNYPFVEDLMRKARFHFGLCVPSTCTADDLTALTLSVAERMSTQFEIGWCEVTEPGTVLKVEHYLSGAFLLLMVSMVFFATGVHYVRYQRLANNDVKAKKPSQLILSLSLIHNGDKLLNAQFRETRFACLNGMRFLTMCWIICTQVYYYGRDVHTGHTITLLEEAQSFIGQVFSNSQPAVDTFFVISGMLVIYLGLPKVQKSGGQIELHNYYFHRYIRLTPAFMWATAVLILLPLFGSGPMWKQYLFTWSNNCVQKWWTNVLYIASWYDRRDMCLPYAWFLSVDMMFYVISPFLILLFYRHKYVALITIPCTIVFSMMITGLFTYYYNLVPLPLVNEPANREEEYLSYLQTKIYPHIAPYCVGILLGYFLQSRKTITFNKFLLIGGWIVAIGTLIAVIYGPYTWNAGRYPPTTESVIFAVFNKTCWSLGVAWVILTCATNNAGWINGFLSWSGFTLVGRLTYCSFLLHPLVIKVYNATSRTMEPYRTVHFLLISLGSILATYTMSFFASLFFESPFVGVQKIQVTAPIVNMYRRRKSSVLNLEAIGDLARRHSVKPQEVGHTDASKSNQTRRLSIIQQELANITEERNGKVSG